MVRYYQYSANFDKNTEELFKNAKFLGEGHNGIVYSLPENKAIKIFQDKNICREELQILLRVKKSKYFPKVYSYGEYYIVREEIAGERLDHFIEKNGFSKELALNIYKLINEFHRLKFTKLDARCRDIYVDKNKKIRIIDPKQCYTRKVDYPRHLMKGLKGINILEEFLQEIEKIDSQKGAKWRRKINEYYEIRDK